MTTSGEAVQRPRDGEVHRAEDRGVLAEGADGDLGVPGQRCRCPPYAGEEQLVLTDAATEYDEAGVEDAHHAHRQAADIGGVLIDQPHSVRSTVTPEEFESERLALQEAMMALVEMR